ncbi:hypothetical protein FG386_001479 [Cryptosporidium ryanae]|uniref:uncharacterized protein n=1 Tax=Cryptosporidium ryanae TaxID=515981 RepID=UPI00351A7A5C|nr:hypothetical protein FG386_001479 [Cryptosporidium ryanae]
MCKKKGFEIERGLSHDLFVSFLEDLAKNEELGGSKAIKHSKNVLNLFLKEAPEKLFHSKRYSSQSTSGSVSGVFSPSYKSFNRKSIENKIPKETQNSMYIDECEVNQKEGFDLSDKKQKANASTNASSGLTSYSSSFQFHHFYPSSSSGRMSSGGNYLGSCFGDGLSLSRINSSLESNYDSDEYTMLLGDNEAVDNNMLRNEGCIMSESTRSGSPSTTGSGSNSPSIYRVMTSSTSTFPTRDDTDANNGNSKKKEENENDCISSIESGMERLNMALREDRIKRISTHTNKIWPSSVSSYLHGIDLFLKIPKYVHPIKKNGILSLSIGSFSHPHPSKIHYGGEDAHFFEDNVIGIADGVGEWVNYGVNPKAFANELILGIKKAFLCVKGLNNNNNTHNNCVDSTSNYTNNNSSRLIKYSNTCPDESLSSGNNKNTEFEFGGNNVDKAKLVTKDNHSKSSPGFFSEYNELQSNSQYLLSEGYKNTKSFGSSTVFVACFDPRINALRISYLGDSGIIVLRRIPETFRMGIVYRSPAQQHSFNCPYQLSKLPTKDDYPKLREKGLNYFINLVKNSENTPQDLPTHSISKEIPLLESDLIIIATDGLFDNLYDYEICNICSGAISPYEAIRLLKDITLFTSSYNISKALTNAAYIKSLDSKAKTPFNRQSVMNNEPWQFSFGGKLDDITVVVAWVVSENDKSVLNSSVDNNCKTKVDNINII